MTSFGELSDPQGIIVDEDGFVYVSTAIHVSTAIPGKITII